VIHEPDSVYEHNSALSPQLHDPKIFEWTPYETTLCPLQAARVNAKATLQVVGSHGNTHRIYYDEDILEWYIVS